MAPILAPILGVHFFRGHISLKMGRFAPFLATIQALSKTCVFLFISFQAIAPLTGQKKGVLFLRGHTSLKNGTFCPLFSHDTSSFKYTCLLTKSENGRKLLCMGRTFTANKPLPLNNSSKQLSVSWESNPARVVARGK
jgi:hypothetical protein